MLSFEWFAPPTATQTSSTTVSIMCTNFEPAITNTGLHMLIVDRTGNFGISNSKHGMHVKIHSQQMLDSMAVEDELSRQLKPAKLIVKGLCLLCAIILIILMIICGIDGTLLGFTTDGNPDRCVDTLDECTLPSEFVSCTDKNEVNSITQSEDFGCFQHQIFFTLSDYAGDFDENNPSKIVDWILTPQNTKAIIKWENKIAEEKEWV